MKKSRKILIGILVCIIIGCVSYIAYYYMKQDRNEKVYEEVQKEAVKPVEEKEEETPQESHVEIPINFAELQAKNPDIYAWIQIDGTNINYPLVQSATDNEYYLNHTIEGQEGYPGSIYTENGNTKEFTEFNTVIYGHDMKDGSMFQNLHNYTDMTYMQQHPNVIIYTPDQKLTYQIFAATVYDDRHILYSFDFAFEEERQKFLDSIYNAKDLGKVIREDVSVNTDSRILTLSTCMTGQDEKRFLVEAVLVNEEK
ncbi:MAG: class B sortase [Lachnospiraceae bacterium]|uniref:class B sortase n=1 Tax=Mediterraneibacter gnavus TaxID=33038 RepID=UPI001D279754|nr:class B sortase [Lachnospiraceae bacterium]